MHLIKCSVKHIIAILLKLNRFIILHLFISSLFSTQAMASDYDALLHLIKNNLNNGNYLGVINKLKKHKKQYAHSSSRMFYFDYLASCEAFLGLNKQALKHDDVLQEAQGLQDEIDTNKYKIKNAKNIIIKASKTHQVIFINEAHHAPQHRAFTLSLLQDLYNQGYRYFAAEGIEQSDSLLNSRGYPISQKTGFLINEPMYGELIRAARKIGYTIIAYDVDPGCDAFSHTPQECINIREKGQAESLYEQVFKTNPSAKLLVHAGYGHIAKVRIGDWVPMAVYFEQITSIQPYSIDQTLMREHSSPSLENNVYKTVIHSNSLEKNSAFITNDGVSWMPLNLNSVYDLIVFQPRTNYKNNRPNWLFNIEKREMLSLSNKQCKGDFPCVVEALIEQEGLESVPYDRLVISSLNKQESALALTPGIKYIIRTINQKGTILSLKYGITVGKTS
jgi:hypothetical protein